MFTCIICTDIMTSETMPYVTRCGHIFHHACLMRWIVTSHTCPQCRNPLSLNCIFRIYPTTVSDAQSPISAQQKKLKEQEEKLKVYEAALKRKEETLKAKEADMEKKVVINGPSNEQTNGRETSATGQSNTSTSATNLINGNRAELLRRTEHQLEPAEYLKMPEDLKIELERALNAALQRDLSRKIKNINLNRT